MPKIIQTMCEVLPEEGVRVRSAYLRNDIKATALVAEAQRRVKDLTIQVENEAERIHRKAKAEGYAAGIIQAAGEVANYLAGHTQLASQLQLKLQDQVRALLHVCVTNPDVVLATFEEYLSEQELGPSASLEFILPESFRSNHRSLTARLLENFHGPTKIEYRPEPRFMLRVGDHVAEFSPEDFVMQASGRVMSGIPSIYAECRAVAEACHQHLSAIFVPTLSVEAEHQKQEREP